MFYNVFNFTLRTVLRQYRLLSNRCGSRFYYIFLIISGIVPSKTRCPYDRGKLSSLSMPRAVSYRRHGAQILRLPCRSITITLLFRTHHRGDSLGLYTAHFRSTMYSQLPLRLNLFGRHVSRYQR